MKDGLSASVANTIYNGSYVYSAIALFILFFYELGHQILLLIYIPVRYVLTKIIDVVIQAALILYVVMDVFGLIPFKQDR